MLGEAIKILADEPEKIEKAVLRGIKLLLSILIAVSLYRLIIGPFTLFPIDSFSDWGDYFLSGRILICLLFYFISDYIIIPLISLPAYLLAVLFTRIKVKPDADDFRRIFKALKIVDYKNPADIPMPGKNIDILYNLSKAFGQEDARDEVDSLKNSFIGNVVNLYSTFVIIYFFLLEPGLHNKSLNIIVLSFLVVVLLSYSFIHGLLEYMLNHYQEIISGLSFIKTNAVIISMLAAYGIYPEWGIRKDRLSKSKIFHVKDKEYVLTSTLSGRQIKPVEIERFMNSRKKQGRLFFVVIEKGLLSSNHDFLLKHFDQLILIEYTDENNLRAQLKNTIEGIIQ